MNVADINAGIENKKRGEAQSVSGQALSRRYSLIATAGVVPLILVIILLAWFQFRSQHDQLIEDLEGEVVKHGTLFGNIIDTVRDHVRSMGAWAEIYAKDPSLSAEAALEEGRDGAGAVATPAFDPLSTWRPADSRVFAKGGALSRRHAGELGLAEGLTQHMRLAHRAMPYLRWSYYFAADSSFFSLYPLRQDQAPGGILQSMPDDLVVETMVAQPIARGMVEGDGAVSRPSWTPAFQDPAGAGWIVAHATRVSLGEGRHGLVGAAVLLDFLTGFIRAYDYPCGKTWLVNDQGQVLAASDGRRAMGLRLLTVDDVLPDDLGDLDIEELTAPSIHFKRVGDVNLLSRPIVATPWHLLYVVEESEVTALILPRFVPYGVILIGFLLTAMLAQQLRQRLIVGPALALADYIKAESQELPKPPPELPSMWRPWVRTVSEAFAAKHEVNRRIQESEAYFRTLAEAHPVPVAIINLGDGRILHASSALADLFEMPLDDLIGGDIRRVHAVPGDREAYIQRLLEAGGLQNFEIPMKRRDGSVFPASVSSKLIDFRGDAAIISGIVDLTEKKATEAKIAQQRDALELSEQRFRTIAEGHPVPLAIVRCSDQKMLYASLPLSELLGVPRSTIADIDLRDFYESAEDRRRIAEILNERQMVDNIEINVRRADGSVFPVAVTSKLMTYEGEEAYVSSFVDLTDKKRAENEITRQREALHQAEKLNALGSLLASVAHELNNPLSVVLGYATMQRDLSDDPTSIARAEKIHAAAERCARIVRTFLAMARQKQAVYKPVKVGDVIDAALEIAAYGLRTADIELEKRFAADLPDLVGDADQLTLVFMNLIVNAQHALQAREGQRTLRIATGKDRTTVWVAFADNGPGVDAGIVQRIFEPFFTTKPQGVGTGIGLSVCRSIIAAHDGEITVASNLEGGALFRVGLPILEATATVENGWREVEGHTAIKGSILVVEDEPEIAEMVAEMLMRDGHDVRVAHSGRAALDKIEDQAPDVVVTDIRMPGLGGPDLHRILEETRPLIAKRILFMTGDTLAHDLGDFMSRANLPLLEKPLEPQTLRREVQGVLARRGQPTEPAG